MDTPKQKPLNPQTIEEANTILSKMFPVPEERAPTSPVPSKTTLNQVSNSPISPSKQITNSPIKYSPHTINLNS